MFTLGELIFILFAWSFVGFFITTAILETSGLLSLIEGFEYLNPFWIYKNTRTNIIGTAFLTIIYNSLSPFTTFCYWFYKICTIGRKEE